MRLPATLFDGYAEEVEAKKGRVVVEHDADFDAEGNCIGHTDTTTVYIRRWQDARLLSVINEVVPKPGVYAITKVQTRVTTEADGSVTRQSSLYGYPMKKTKPTERKSRYEDLIAFKVYTPRSAK